MSDLHDWLRDHRFFKQGKAEAMSDPMRFSDQIMLAAAGSCTCGAKSPEFILHNAHCRYAMLLVCADRADIVADEIASLTAALAEAEAERDRLRNAVSRYVEATEAEPAVRGGLFRELRALTRPAAQPEGERDG